jgi:hypothetical protein
MRPHRDMEINLMLLPSHTPAEHPAPSHVPEALEQHRRLGGLLDRSVCDVPRRGEGAGGAPESMPQGMARHPLLNPAPS